MRPSENDWVSSLEKIIGLYNLHVRMLPVHFRKAAK
jgi:hypothetical protein